MGGKTLRKVALAAAVLLALGFLAGCVPPGVVLQGTITDASTGDPVPGTEVQIFSDASETFGLAPPCCVETGLHLRPDVLGELGAGAWIEVIPY